MSPLLHLYSPLPSPSLVNISLFSPYHNITAYGGLTVLEIYIHCLLSLQSCGLQETWLPSLDNPGIRKAILLNKLQWPRAGIEPKTAWLPESCSLTNLVGRSPRWSKDDPFPGVHAFPNPLPSRMGRTCDFDGVSLLWLCYIIKQRNFADVLKLWLRVNQKGDYSGCAYSN